jgi:hypothetical protein
MYAKGYILAFAGFLTLLLAGPVEAQQEAQQYEHHNYYDDNGKQPDFSLPKDVPGWVYPNSGCGGTGCQAADQSGHIYMKCHLQRRLTHGSMTTSVTVEAFRACVDSNFGGSNQTFGVPKHANI